MLYMPKHLEVGKLGEDIACRFIKQKGYSIIVRNYWKKWGEIDIIAQKDHILRFIEVKSVSRDLPAGKVGISQDNVTHVTSNQKRPNNNGFKPEDAVHPWKVKRLKRVIQSYLIEKNISQDLPAGKAGTQWQFDIISVYLDMKTKQAKVRFLENVGL